MYTRILFSSPKWALILREIYLACLCVFTPCLFMVRYSATRLYTLTFPGCVLRFTFVSIPSNTRPFSVHLPPSLHLSAMNHNHTSKAYFAVSEMS